MSALSSIAELTSQTISLLVNVLAYMFVIVAVGTVIGYVIARKSKYG